MRRHESIPNACALLGRRWPTRQASGARGVSGHTFKRRECRIVPRAASGEGGAGLRPAEAFAGSGVDSTEPHESGGVGFAGAGAGKGRA
jgi:hypothetical protein